MSGPKDETSRSHESKDWEDPVLTKNVEEKTVQPDIVVDVAKVKTTLGRQGV